MLTTIFCIPLLSNDQEQIYQSIYDIQNKENINTMASQDSWIFT